MENTNPTMPPPPPNPNPNPYQQAPGGYQAFNHGGQGFAMQTDVPGAGAAQVCGIIGIVLFFNLIGIILNIIAIVNGSKAMNEYNAQPGRYTEASFRKAKAGKTCGIVGLCLLGFGVVVAILIAVAVNL